MRTLSQELAVRTVGTPGTWSAAAQYGTTWHSMVGYNRALFVLMVGELDADLPVAIYEATDSDGTSAQAVTGLSGTFVNGTDEGKVGLIEVLSSDLTDGFPYVNIRVTPGATDAFAAAVLLGEAVENPVSNTAADGVSFVDRLA